MRAIKSIKAKDYSPIQYSFITINIVNWESKSCWNLFRVVSYLREYTFEISNPSIYVFADL